jgi:hypothetical protein
MFIGIFKLPQRTTEFYAESHRGDSFKLCGPLRLSLWISVINKEIKI